MDRPLWNLKLLGIQVCQHEVQKPKIVDQSLRGEGQCLAYSAKHNYNTGRKLRSQLQMADRMSVRGEKGDFLKLEGNRRA